MVVGAVAGGLAVAAKRRARTLATQASRWAAATDPVAKSEEPSPPRN
jgi:Flp pilus assembly protein TadG